LVPDGVADSSVVTVKRVAELDYYSLRFNGLGKKLGITTNQTTALITLLQIKENGEYAKQIISTWCYSPKALERLREALKEKPVAEWWKEYPKARPQGS
jgi:hypothetical protein